MEYCSANVLQTAAMLRANHHEICFHFYSNDATEVAERLDHGNLDFAVLLQPIDTTKYEYILLSDSAQWGILMPSDCPLAQKGVVSKEDFCQIPLVLHQRTGLQQEIALWAQAQLEHLNIVATYNVVHGSPVPFVTNELGYFPLTIILPRNLTRRCTSAPLTLR